MKLASSLRRAGRAKPSVWRRHHRLCSQWRGGAAALAQALYYADGSGNVMTLWQTNGTLAAKYLYDPFGGLLAALGTSAGVNRYRFSSKEWEPNAGLYYYGYRFYDPNMQRWVNRDPIGEASGLNLYGYVANNPNNLIDSLGLDWQCSGGIGGTVGGSSTGGFGVGAGGSTSVGLTSSGQLFIQFQAAGMVASGAYAGVGFQGGISQSSDPTPSGISTTGAIHAEADAADGVSLGVSSDVGPDGSGIGFPIPGAGRIGVGFGVMAGVGASTTTTIATPPIIPWIESLFHKKQQVSTIWQCQDSTGIYMKASPTSPGPAWSLVN